MNTIIANKYILGEKQTRFIVSIKPNTAYSFQVRIEHQGQFSKWSDGNEFTTTDFKPWVWKKRSNNTEERKYSVDESNLRIATNTSGHNGCVTIIGRTYIPLNKVTLWSIKVLKPQHNDGGGIFVGVTSFNINQNCKGNYGKCGKLLFLYS